MRCQCQQRRIADERIREVLAGWPKYSGADLATMEPRTLQQLEALKLLRADPSGSYYIHGDYLAGKTRLLVAQYRHVALAGEPCALRSSKELVDELRTAENDPQFYSPVLLSVNREERFHLFWDDVEKAAARSDFREEAIWDLLDKICRRNLKLSCTSNLALVGLASSGRATHPIVSRIDRICQVIEL